MGVKEQNAVSYHEPPHPLLLDALVLLLLLALCVGVVRGHRLGGLLDLPCDGAVVLLEVLGVLQDAIEVFLWAERRALRAIQVSQLFLRFCVLVHMFMYFPSF